MLLPLSLRKLSSLTALNRQTIDYWALRWWCVSHRNTLSLYTTKLQQQIRFKWNVILPDLRLLLPQKGNILNEHICQVEKGYIWILNESLSSLPWQYISLVFSICSFFLIQKKSTVTWKTRHEFTLLTFYQKHETSLWI